MPDSVAFGVRNVGQVGTTDVALRKILGSLYPSAGIVAGCRVTGRSNLAYNVAEGVAVCRRGTTDGSTLAWVQAGTTPTVSANRGSNPRLDAIWVTAHDVTQGDSDNLVTLGVTQGTPAATPSVPDIPTGATLLAVMQMPAGATKTSSASAYIVGAGAIPYGSSLGIMLDETDRGNDDVDPNKEATIAAGTINIPTRRQVDFKFTITVASKATGDSSVYVLLYVDGAKENGNEVRAFGAPQTASSQYFEFSSILEPGEHSIKATIRGVPGRPTVRRYWQANTWAGQRLQVVDAGAVQ